MAAAQRTSRFPLNLYPDSERKVKAVAEREKRTMSDVINEFIRIGHTVKLISEDPDSRLFIENKEGRREIVTG